MYHSFGDPNDIISTIRDLSKKRIKKNSKSGDPEEISPDGGKILEISGVISLNNTDLPDGDEEKIRRRDKEDKKVSTLERRSFPTFKFKFGSRKKSNQENESRRTSTETDPREGRESLESEGTSATDSTSASDEKRSGERESITSSDGLALEILKEINTDNLGINKGFTNVNTDHLNSQNIVEDGNAQETVELRSSSTSENTEQREKRRKTRSGNFFNSTENSIFDIPENLPDSSSITSPTLNLDPLYQLYSLNPDQQNKPELTTSNSKRPRIFDLVSTNKRVYWRDIPEVIDSGYSEKLSQDERNLQEAKFEILTSEGSYLKSLKVLERHYIKNILLLGLRLKHLLSEGDLKMLFGNVVEVRKISENFLRDLEELWQKDILLGDIEKVIGDHMENFEIYKIYSKKYLDMTQKCNDLMGQKEEFKDLLETLRQSPPAENLPMTSFFTLPIQRIARYHMLVENLIKFMRKREEECENTVLLWENLKELARQCDSEIQKRKRTEEMVKLIRQLEFAPGVENICILKSSRYLDLQNQIWKVEFREKIDRQHISIKKINYRLFLFNDLFIMAKKSLDKLTPENLIVVDYCLRKSVKMKPMKRLELFGIRELTEAKPVVLNLQSNHRNESVEMIISFEKPSDREQWITALESTPPTPAKPIRTTQTGTYQILIANDYEASNPLELTLKKGDVIDVKEKRTEVWILGENTEIGAQGWFPEECTAEIIPGSIKQVKKEIRFSNEKYIIYLDGFVTPGESYV